MSKACRVLINLIALSLLLLFLLVCVRAGPDGMAWLVTEREVERGGKLRTKH